MALIRFTNRPALAPRPLFDDLPDRIRQMFEGPFDQLAQPLGWMPAMEIIEKNGALLLTAELPGVDSKNVDITVENGVLTIRGEKKEEHKEGEPEAKYYVWERTYGAFQRSFTLPSDIDAEKIAAKFDNGVLTLTLPKTEKAKALGKKIPIAVK
jgi:HSP20 family protein